MTLISNPPAQNSIFQFPPNFPNGAVSDAWIAWFQEVQANNYVFPTAQTGFALGWDAGGNLVNVPNTGADQTAAWTAADNLIRSDLANTASNALGPALVGYNPALTYPASTVGSAIASKVATADLASTSPGLGAALVGVLQPFTGAVGTTQDEVNSRVVNLFDFMSQAKKTQALDGVTYPDVTAELTYAQSAADLIIIPPCRITLDNFKQENGKVFRGGGLNNTWIKQGTTGNPAWWCVSKAGVYETQIIGAELSGVWFLGKPGATVAACIVEAISPFVVQSSRFDIGGSGCFHTLEVKAGSAYEVYLSSFRVFQDDPDGRSGGVGSTDVGVVCGAGVYNSWDLTIAKPATGKAFTSSDWGGVFLRAVCDGSQVYNGSHNTILAPTVEGWTGAIDANGAIQVLGASNRLIGVSLTNVPSAKCGGIGVSLNGGGGNNTTIIGYRVFGTYPLTAPVYPMSIPAGNTGTISDAQTSGCQFKLDAYTADSILKGWSFIGDCSGLVANYPQVSPYSNTWVPTLAFGGGSTGITYTVQQANIQRIGAFAMFDITINLSNKGSSAGAATIGGLPIPARVQANHQTPCTVYTENVTIPSGYVASNIQSGGSVINLIYATSGGGASSFQDGQFANNSLIRISGIYPI